MKTVDLSTKALTLNEILELAARENVVVKAKDGREYVVAELDDLDEEITLVRQNKELTDFLTERSQDQERFTVDQAKARLGLK